MSLLTQIAHGLVAVPVAFVAGWIGTRHNAKAAANARASLAQMGAACPDDGEGLLTVAEAFGVTPEEPTPLAVLVADFDMWEEQVRA